MCSTVTSASQKSAGSFVDPRHDFHDRMLQFINYLMSFASVTVPYSSSKCCFELICSRHNTVWPEWWISNSRDPQSPLWTCCVMALLFTISSQLHPAWIVRIPLFRCFSSSYSDTPLQSCLCCLCDWSAWIWGLLFYLAQLLSRSRVDVSQSQCCAWACYQSHLTCRGEGTISARALSPPMEAKP